MLVPAFAEELKFQSGAGTRIVTMSLKARAAITMAGHQGDSVTWFDGATGDMAHFHRVSASALRGRIRESPSRRRRFRQDWALLLPESGYLYEKIAVGTGPPAGYGAAFPHPLRGIATALKALIRRSICNGPPVLTRRRTSRKWPRPQWTS